MQAASARAIWGSISTIALPVSGTPLNAGMMMLAEDEASRTAYISPWLLPNR